MKSLSGRGRHARLAWLTVVPLILVTATTRADQVHRFNIPRGDLASLLTQIALTSGMPIVAPADLVAGRMAGPISGCGSAEAALMLALAGTSLVVGADRGNGLVVRGPTADLSASVAMRWASGKPAGDMPSDRDFVPAEIGFAHRSSKLDCSANDETSASEAGGGAAASGIFRPERER